MHSLLTFTKVASTLIILVMWQWWKERNRRVFQNKISTHCEILVVLIEEEAKLWEMAGAKRLKELTARANNDL